MPVSFRHGVGMDMSTVLASVLSAPTYYVDATNGSDSNTGKSPGTAWKTLAKLTTESAAGTFKAGDYIAFKAGETWTNESFTFSQSGSPSARIRFGVYGGTTRPVFDGNSLTARVADFYGERYIRVEGLDIRNATQEGIRFGANSATAADIEFVDCVVDNCTSQNVQLEENCVALVSGCTLSNSPDDGISYHSQTYTLNLVVENTIFDGNVQGFQEAAVGVTATFKGCTWIDNNQAITMSASAQKTATVTASMVRTTGVSGKENTFSGNIDFDYCIFDYNGATLSFDAIKAQSASVVMTADNCVFYGGPGNGGTVWANVAGATITARNCVFIDWGRFGWTTSTNETSDYCMFDNVTQNNGTNTNVVTGPANLNAPASDDFRPKTGSNCIDAGLNIGLTTDYAGLSVGDPPNIGAHEEIV